MSLLAHQMEMVERTPLMKVSGRVTEITGLTMVATGIHAQLGAMCEVCPQRNDAITAQVVGFRGSQTVLMPLTEPLGVAPGDRVSTSTSLQYVPVGRQMVGRVLDGLGNPIDDKGSFGVECRYPVMAAPPSPMTRREIDEPIGTGIKAIDSMHSIGKGQRVGVFAGTGVGKSVLMGMIARNTSSDVSVVALVGERGREVGDFIRKDLGEEGMAKTVMVISTSDESPVLRVRACFVATAIAEFFRDQGNDVMLMMDSVTRMAMAQRQIGLAAGEPPATKGYPPSVFAQLPKLLERSGRTKTGSITGLYTVLVEGDDITEPISDAVRGTLDGHMWLSRKLANRGQYPAVSSLESISRCMVDIVDTEHRSAAQEVKSVLAVWEDIEDLVNIGAYSVGTNVEYDAVIEMKPQVDEFLRQDIAESASFPESCEGLLELAGRIRECRDRLKKGRAAAQA